MREASPLVTPPAISAEHKAQALRRVNAAGVRWLWEWLKSFMVAVWLFLLVRAFLVEAFKIPSGSMERTLLPGDFLLVNKLVYGAEVPYSGGRHLPALRQPDRGDVIVFQWPKDPTKNFVKRLVALPGDTVAMVDGRLFLNGRFQREDYALHAHPGVDQALTSAEVQWQDSVLVRTARAARAGGYHPSRNNLGPLVVPAKSYFVLGDNRDNSSDSRYWGFVPESLVRGRPVLVYFSHRPDSRSRFPWLTGIRWERIGERVR